MNKIFVSTLVFGLLVLFYLVPSPSFDIEVVEEDNKDKKENVVYLLDEDNYVSRVISYYDESDIEGLIREKIKILINGDKSLGKFYSLIPKNTILKDVKVEKDSVYLNFNKEILNVNKYLEESMIEAIVFSLTEINGINNVYINVDSEKLTKLPKSGREIPYPLTRSFGINKKYDLNSLNDIDKTTIYFVKSSDEIEYYVPVTKVNNDSRDKIEIIVDELSSNNVYKTNLMSYLNNNTKVLSVNEDNNEIVVNFNSAIFNDINTKEILEEVIYTISLSINDNYDVSSIVFNVENEEIYKSVNKSIE